MSTLTPEKTRHTNGSMQNDFVSLDGLLTIDDWIALPDTKPRYELIDGKLVQKTLTSYAHAWASGEVLIALMKWGDDLSWHFLPTGTGLKLNEYNGRVPDIVGFSPNIKLDPDACCNENSFLVAEVHSKRTSKRDRIKRLRDYASGGVPMYLIVDPNARTVEIYRLKNAAYGKPEVLSENDVWQPDELPGLKVELARLWMD